MGVDADTGTVTREKSVLVWAWQWEATVWLGDHIREWVQVLPPTDLPAAFAACDRRVLLKEWFALRL